MKKEEVVKGLEALDKLIGSQTKMQRDGLLFIVEKGLWEEFMGFHSDNLVKEGMKNEKDS